MEVSNEEDPNWSSELKQTEDSESEQDSSSSAVTDKSNSDDGITLSSTATITTINTISVPNERVDDPGMFDVLLGRGRTYQHHVGNQHFHGTYGSRYR